MSILQVQGLKKIYGAKGGAKTEALSNVSFEVNKGEFVAIMGESGSGKTTLLNIIATLDKPTEGNIFINGKNIDSIKSSEVSSFRRNELGFVFQDFNLLDTFNNKDNIFLPLVLSGLSPEEMEKRLSVIAPKLGIADLLDKYPYEISGGQKQRVAIARAVITNPALVLADEPTGALDSSSSDMILRIFEDLQQSGMTVIMVTHSLKAASHASRVVFIKDGIAYHEIYRGDMSSQAFMEKINDSVIALSRKGN
ncbi:ABC transporter ATP-binding protein [Actinomyces sp. zg-332]|uniref:ABC transporter ATP-binding protein n=1 Tax=Actinomyces sp. zg-332 TaxID=2708340 RepID=UPI001421B84E|nr:ABC transporter ATP-binding protein [Actinomyces sp. zg-332]QPK94063.1 ABC transporter ATP-binding protein [Actinomyces sp. zg-332]